jgi:hypothetical protein
MRRRQPFDTGKFDPRRFDPLSAASVGVFVAYVAAMFLI